ncbi:Prolyl oligopeptidase family protein [Forsythia ovata]|uniref:Prolyl endopeptidase n=1 Tax=Forsythia ovata TaxID=205694 RepID=A0ABD1WAI4_9LAMI
MAALGALLRFSRVSTKLTHSLLSCHLLSQQFSPAFFSSFCKNKYHYFPPPIQAPPAAKKVPFTATAHGITWQDPHHWMSNTNDPDFISYLHQENSYAEAFMQDTQALQSTLYDEMVSRMPSKISTPPERWGLWLYYQYIPEGKEYPVLCRKLSTGRKGWVNTIVNSFREKFGREQILLDWNDIAEQYGYVHVGTCRISPDHNFLAYTLDTTGDEQFLLQIKDLQSDLILPYSGVDGVVSLAWAQDGRTLFYTQCNENQRPYRVLRTKLGLNSVDDVTIFTENDSNFCVDITSTKDGKFITVYVINATDLKAGLQRFCERVSGVQYFLEHHCGFFYILTNAPLSEDKKFSGNGYYLARCQVEDVRSANLQNVIIPGDDIYVEDMDIFNGHLVLFLNKDGSPSICSIDLPIDTDCKKLLEINDLSPWFFPLPSKMCTIAPGSNHDFMNSVYRVVLSSPVMPDLIVDYDMSRKVFSIVQQEEVTDVLTHNIEYSSPNFDHSTDKFLDFSNENDRDAQDNEIQGWRDLSEKYLCEEKEIVSHDGVRIPLTILFSRSAHQKGQSPGLLHGYGAYAEVLDKSWCPDHLSLLDRGWLLAFADVRGGGGSSPSWHKSGCGFNKLNSIYDFVSCGEYLINEGFVHRGKLGAVGISAGCLLVGAAINMHPELFRAAILKVPFLDVISTLLDPCLPLTTLDYEEFGNPQIQSYFEYILKYSPYDNIPQGVCCPSMLVSASFNDSRVGVWEAAKWVARIRDTACSSCSSSVLLQTNMSGGHFREGGRFAQCMETAYEYAFLMKVMENNENTEETGRKEQHESSIG